MRERAIRGNQSVAGLLELCVVKATRTVLRGGGGSDVTSLPDRIRRRKPPATATPRPCGHRASFRPYLSVALIDHADKDRGLLSTCQHINNRAVPVRVEPTTTASYPPAV